MQERLTAALVRRLAEEEMPTRDTVVFDALLPRFALRLKPPSSVGRPWSSWYFVRFVGRDGRERKFKVGSPATMSLDDARRAARSILAKVDGGGDPARDRDSERAVWTIADMVSAYLDSPEFARKAERTQAEDRATASLHIVHHLGRHKVSAVDVPMIRRLMRAVEEDQRINSRKRRLGGAGAARRIVRLLSAMLTWAVGEGRLGRNPIVGNLRLSGDRQREAVLKPHDLGRLFQTMDDMVADGTLRPIARAFIICAALTGCRRDELRRLRWNDVDLPSRRIVLRDSKGTKLARSGPSVETVSLPPLAVAALAQIVPNESAPGNLVFCPQRGRSIAINRDWNRVRDRAGLSPELVLHSLRHSLGTAGIMGGMSTLEVSKMLRHRNPSMTARYVHLAEAGAARLQDRAAATLLGDPQRSVGD